MNDGDADEPIGNTVLKREGEAIASHGEKTAIPTDAGEVGAVVTADLEHAWVAAEILSIATTNVKEKATGLWERVDKVHNPGRKKQT